ncbi:MAG: MFS transporter [Firmicutes bacterium]|nr:MFS transporter [Bacillota bacterium]
MRKGHYAWAICFAGALLIFITMGIVSNGFSIFLPYIREEYGLTNAQTSTLVTVRLLMNFVSLLFIGFYYDRFNIRLGATISVGFAVAGFLMYSFARTYVGFLAAATVAGLAYGLGSMVPVSILMNRWFHRHKALAISLCSAGSGVGSILVPPVITGLMSVMSLAQVFRLLAFFMLAGMIVIFLIIRNDPRDVGLERYGEYHAGLKEAAANLTKAVPDKGPMPYAVMAIACLSCFLGGAQGNPGMSHIAVCYNSAGFSTVFCATLMSVIGIALTVGKIALGELTDKVGSYRSTIVFSSILIVGNAFTSLAGVAGRLGGSNGAILAIVAVFVLGIGYSLTTIGPAIWAGYLASEMDFPRVLRSFQLWYAFGGLVMGTVPGIMADRFGGSYVPAFMLFTVLAIAASVLMVVAYRKRG